MPHRLSADELVALVERVFRPTREDKRLAILVDMPDEEVHDTPRWEDRREMALEWTHSLRGARQRLGLDVVELVLYRNPRANNADLPPVGHLFSGAALPKHADELSGDEIRFDELFASRPIVIAPTQFSATAPLKVAAKKWRFRAATMPGFARSMVPALRLDYGKIGRRVELLKQILDDAVHCRIVFDVPGRTREVGLDLRYRTAHASSGVFPEVGVAGNLPSGEAYIVPYEGEVENSPSRTNGEIPVQFGDEVVVYAVEQNKAVRVVSDGPVSSKESEQLRQEPAYGNIAELGLGVLGDFGLAPTGEILLDEKLGLHIAFGRSEHFGGQVGPEAFGSPDRVVHIDRVYIPEIQPKISVQRATLTRSDGSELELMAKGCYCIDFGE